MYDFLVKHAIDNVWCDPEQNKQYIFELAKLTPKDGVLNTVSIFKNNISLPLQNVRFHVYQIGQLWSSSLNLPLNNNQWTTISSACNTNDVIVDLYTNVGIELPRFQTWYKVLPDMNLIIAVLNQPKINVDLSIDPLFFRIYSNAFFASGRTNGDSFVKVEGVVVKTVDDIITLQVSFNAVNSLSGVTYAFVNGIKVNTVDLISVMIGDVVEYVYDGSVYKVVDLPIASLQSFTSILDNENKYLLHYPGAGDETIDYQDDIDFFLIQPTSTNRHVGLYYHKNRVDSIRMVTHRDYSMVAAYMVAYLNTLPNWVDLNALTVRMHIRKNGYQRTVLTENNRILELYKLPETEIVQAMIGVNSTVPYWSAAVLENSAYTKLMDINYTGITRALVEEVYGYNLISNLLGNTPSLVDGSSGELLAPVPYGLTRYSVVYEYDASGLLLGWYVHIYGTEYVAVNPTCVMVEMIAGVLDSNNQLDESYGDQTVQLDPTADYRMYTTPIANGNPTNAWLDVTGTDKYTITNNLLTWHVDPTLFYTLVRSNKQVLAYDLMLVADNGLVSFSLTTGQTRNGKTSQWVMQVPMGELEIFLNGHSLIEGVDYIFKFPEVIIININYLVDILTTAQRITVRYTGFCNKDMTSDVKAETGFIEYGLLSYNGKFNVRDGKVIRITVGGKYYSRDQLQFAESSPGITVPNVLNGMAYSIKDVVVPLRGFAITDTYTLRTASQVIDASISGYLTAFAPQPIVPTPNVVSPIQITYSPLVCKILFDMKSGAINDPRLLNQYNDTVVNEICAKYLYLLPYDPANPANQTNTNYVRVLPHYLPTFMTVNIYQFKFITRVIALYLNNAVNLNNFVSVSQ
jgi:hypothetical protein